MTTPSADKARELALRSGDGLTVTLLWRPATNRVSVVVVDTRAGDSFRIDVPPERALDAYHHPYAWADVYGATRRSDTAIGLLQQAETT